jgi:hypothetical protein
MTMVAFNSDNEIHKQLFSAFKKALVSPTNEKDDLLAQHTDYVDNLDIILRDIAVEDLGADPEISDMEGYWAAAITNDTADNFGIICGFEFIGFDDEPEHEYLKCEGGILVEDDAQIVFDIDPTSIDYSSEKEFNKHSQKAV